MTENEAPPQKTGVSENGQTVLDDMLGFNPEEQLATRAAWLYFVAGNTQAKLKQAKSWDSIVSV